MDELLVMAFERDDPFTMDDNECFFNKKTHEVIFTGDGLSSVKPVGENWIIVPGTSHREWHEVFKEWLSEIGESEAYTTSIGLTLKNLGEGYRHEWYEKKTKYAEQKARQFQQKFSDL
jgi:hypothetical protein